MTNQSDRYDGAYIIMVNSPILREAAQREGFCSVYLLSPAEEDLPWSWILGTVELGAETVYKAFVYIHFDETHDQMSQSEELLHGLKSRRIPHFDLNLRGGFSPITGKRAETVEEAAGLLPTKDMLVTILEQEELLLDPKPDYTGRCGNCTKHMGEEDKYCRYCGTPRGEGKFLPYRNDVYCVYGPPITSMFQCPSCGFSWKVSTLGYDNAKYCPKCRHEVECTSERGF